MIHYVTDPFDMDGESFQTGDHLTSEQYEKLRHPENYGNINKVTQLTHMAEERARMRDATPNKPVHANVHPSEATVGHSGASVSVIRTKDHTGKDVDHAAMRKQIVDDFTAPLAPNEGDTRKSVLTSLMGEHGNDPNYLKAHGVPNADEAKALGTKPLEDREATKDDYHAPPVHASVSDQAGNVVTIDAAAPVQRIAVVEDPAKTPDDSGAHDRANEPGKGLPSQGSGGEV